MDNLTHALMGVHLARSGGTPSFARRNLWLLVLASNLPDADALLALFGGPLRFLSRRMYTHSLLGIAVTAALTAFAFRYLFSASSWASLFRLSLLGLGIHVGMDLVNSYGVVLLHPFTYRRFELACVFIVDPWIWAILALPFLLSLLPSWAPSRRALARLSLLGLGVYLALCWTARTYASGLLDRAARREGKAPDYAYVFPEPFGPHRFRGVLRYGGEYRVFLIHVIGGHVELQAAYPTEAESPGVRAILRTRPAQRLDWFYAAPVWSRVASDLYQVFDLRFQSAVAPWRGQPFSFRFRVRDGDVEGPIPTPLLTRSADSKSE